MLWDSGAWSGRMRASLGKPLGLVLRFLVAALLLAWVFHRSLPSQADGGLGALLEAWKPSRTGLDARPSPWLTLLSALGVIGAGFGVNALRFRGLLRAAGAPARWGTLLRAYLIGGFFNLVLPGAILGDAYRVMDARQLAGRTSHALGLVFLERLLGLSALGTIGLVALPFLPGELVEFDALSWLPLCLACVFLVATLAVLHPAGNRLLRSSIQFLGRPMPRISAALVESVEQAGRMRQQRRVLWQTFGLSLVAQGLLVLSLFVLGLSLQDRVDWYWYPVIIPFATLVSLVPISIGAAGVREYLYVTLFGMIGMGSASALALSLSIFGATLIWGLVGLALFCFWPRASGRGGTS